MKLIISHRGENGGQICYRESSDFVLDILKHQGVGRGG